MKKLFLKACLISVSQPVLAASCIESLHKMFLKEPGNVPPLPCELLPLRQKSILEVRAVIRGKLGGLSKGGRSRPEPSGPLPSQCIGQCGLSTAAVHYHLRNRLTAPELEAMKGFELLPHQLLKLFGPDSYRHSVLFIPLEKGKFGVIVDLTFKQFNGAPHIQTFKDAIEANRELGDKEVAAHTQQELEAFQKSLIDLGYKNTPVGYLAGSPIGRRYLGSIFRDGYAVVDQSTLDVLAEAMNVDLDGKVARTMKRPNISEFEKATDPDLVGPTGADVEYDDGYLKRLFEGRPR